MSLAPHWEIIKPILQNSLPNEIKYPISRRYFGTDGSLYGTQILGNDDVTYLEGLRDGGNEYISRGAKILIDAIRKHGEILFVID